MNDSILKRSLKVFVICGLVFTAAACSDNDAEEAGEKIDKIVEDRGNTIDGAATDAGNAIEDACEEVKEGVNAKDKDC